MAVQLNRTAQVSQTVGLANMALGQPVSGYQSFFAASGGADLTVTYGIVDPVSFAWEVGVGLFEAATSTLRRNRVIASSAAGAKVNFPVGDKVVYATEVGGGPFTLRAGAAGETPLAISGAAGQTAPVLTVATGGRSLEIGADGALRTNQVIEIVTSDQPARTRLKLSRDGARFAQFACGPAGEPTIISATETIIFSVLGGTANEAATARIVPAGNAAADRLMRYSETLSLFHPKTAQFAAVGASYTKAEADARYPLKAASYTKAEADARYALAARTITGTGGVTGGGSLAANRTLSLDPAWLDARYIGLDGGGFIKTGSGGFGLRVSANIANTNAAFRVDSAAAQFSTAYFALVVFENGIKQAEIMAKGGAMRNRNNVFGAISDARMKENVTDATPQLQDLLAMQVRRYNLKGQPGEPHIGLIAQEVERVKPGLVERDADGMLSLKYSLLVPMLVKALQELHAEFRAYAAAHP